MGKRSDFPKHDRDFYQTPRDAAAVLVPHLRGVRRYAEPCAGAGALIQHLGDLKGLQCTYSADIHPERDGILRRDAFDLRGWMLGNADVIITNPPWTRSRKKDTWGYPLIPLIEHCASLLPTWFLIDADFMHIKMAAPVMARCAKVVSIGRVRWIEGTTDDGKDNACWYLFRDRPCATRFVGNVAA